MSTESSYTTYVQLGDPNFELRLKVTDSGIGEFAQTANDEHQVHVNSDDGTKIQSVETTGGGGSGG